MSKIHCLKTWPVYFEAIKCGDKTFEVRLNDRDFKVDDILILQEFNFMDDSYTGRTLPVKVSYVMDANNHFILRKVIDSNFVILGIQIIKEGNYQCLVT